MSSTLALLGGKPLRKKPFHPWPVYGPPEEKALLRVLKSGQWGRHDGGEVIQFEQRFAAYHQTAHGIAVTSGTTALRIALLAAGLQAGDEVIVPPYTFLATATAVVEVNAIPIFVDVERDSFNLDPARIEAAITPRTRAIIPVHFGGLAADMDAIMAIARKHKLIVIEDAAHAHGGEYKGRRLGSIGDMACYSFQATKNMTAGEGGMILSNNDRLAQACWSIHNCGRKPEGVWYDHHVISGNHRMTEFQAAVLSCQLDRLDEQTATREANGQYLAGRLASLPGVATQRRTADHTRHSYHLFLVRYDPRTWGVPRELAMKAMQAEGIPIDGGYPLGLYRQPLFKNLAFGPYTGYKAVRPDLDYSKSDCPVCEELCRESGAWIAHHHLLGPRQDMDDIADAFGKVYDNRQALANHVQAKAAAAS